LEDDLVGVFQDGELHPRMIFIASDIEIPRFQEEFTDHYYSLDA
jgi:hypothetical protein